MNKLDDIIANIKTEIKRDIENNTKDADNTKNIQSEDIRDFVKIVNLPYDLLSSIDNDFSLSDKEKEINEMLGYMVLIYYLPEIDLGKVALYLFIIYNISLLGLKGYKVYTKRKMKTEPELKPEPEPEPEPELKPEPEPELKPEPKPEPEPKTEPEPVLKRKRGRPKKNA
jgi:hypothetical protein